MTTESRETRITATNALGLQEYDLVQTAGKGIGIVLRKKSLNDELVIYSISSASETHPFDDDGMAKVRRYNSDGIVAEYSERTGRRLKNCDIYTITGVKSYVNPVLAMKDFINQNEDIEFDPVIEPVIEEEVEPEIEEVVESEEVAAVSSQDEVSMQILSMLMKINEKLDNI